MRTIVIGKEGNQPFKINAGGVSREHARVDIDDKGRWTLTDLDSTNGTFVRNEQNGKLVRVGNIDIHPMSFICLGPDGAQGCSFYARQLLKENCGRYKEEFEYLNEVADRYDEKMERTDRRIKWFKWVSPAVNLLIVIVSCVIQLCLPDSTNMNFALLRAGSIITAVLSALFDFNGLKKKIEQERQRFFQCPNPACDNVMKVSEIRNYKCGKCRK